MIRAVLLVVVLVTSSVSVAAVYKCVDRKGNTSYSSVPCPAKRITGDSGAHKLWKVLQGYSVRGKSIVRSVRADVESIKSCKALSKKYQKDLETLKEKVDRLDSKHEYMVKAYNILPYCGVCQARGLGRCTKVDRYLDRAKNALIAKPVKKPPPWARKRKKKSSQ